VLHGDPSPPPPKGHSPPVFGSYPLQPNGCIDQDVKPPIFVPCLLWPNGWMDQDATWLGGRSRPRRHCIRWRPSPAKGIQPQFLAYVCCGQMTGWIEMPLRMEVGLGPDDIVLDGDPTPLKRAKHPHFSTHVYCGQTAGWIKIPLGTEIELGPGHVVLDGELAPTSKKGVQRHPIFGPCLLWPSSRSSQPSRLCVRWGPSTPPQKGAEAPNFRPTSNCDQRAAWIKMPLGTEGRRPTRHCVRWGPSSPSLKGHSPLIFGECPLWPNG